MGSIGTVFLIPVDISKSKRLQLPFISQAGNGSDPATWLFNLIEQHSEQEELSELSCVKLTFEPIDSQHPLWVLRRGK